MAELKTKPTKVPVSKYIAGIKHKGRQEDARELLKIFSSVAKPVMWGPSIVGYGEYHYESDAGQVGDWPVIGWSARAAYMVVYIMPGFKSYKDDLKKLGKHRLGGSCLYFNRLSDIDPKILKKIIKSSISIMKKRYPTKGLK